MSCVDVAQVDDKAGGCGNRQPSLSKVGGAVLPFMSCR